MMTVILLDLAGAVVVLVVVGLTDGVGAMLVIAPDTLKSHLRNLYRKVGVRNRVEFTLLAIKEYSSPSDSGETGSSDR